jgi:hypothetical protein
VGFLPFDEYELFCDMAKRVHLRLEETKLGEVTRAVIGDVKFYTDTK